MSTLHDWTKPTVLSPAEVAFGAADRIADVLPLQSDIPAAFWERRSTKWHEIQARWFFEGLPADTKFTPKPSIDRNTALRHLQAVQGSFFPKHEHKCAAVAWLMSLWFEDIEVPAAALRDSKAGSNPVRTTGSEGRGK